MEAASSVEEPIVAEAVGVPLRDVRLVMGDTDLCPHDEGTFGSRSTPDAGRELQVVGEAARGVLDGLAGAPGRTSERIGELVHGLRRVEVASPAGRRRSGAAAEERAGRTSSTRSGVPRLTGPSIVTGTKRYPSDIIRPGMRHGQVLRPPAAGAALRSVELGEVTSDGVTLVHEGAFVGVVAATPDQARSALARAKPEWDLPNEPGEVDLESHLRAHPVEDEGWEGGFHRATGDVGRALETAQIRIDATYRTAFIAHVPMETRAAVAEWSDDGREDEFRHGYLRPAAVIDIRAGADRGGRLTAWEMTNLNSGSFGLTGPYEVPNLRLEYQAAASPLPQGSYRALAATANHFARESAMDEVAVALEIDPLELRLTHLGDGRLAAALGAAADRIDWTREREQGVGLGIAGGIEKEARVATAVELRVGEDRRLLLARVVTAFDCGRIVNPDALTNQIQGAISMGLGGALFEAVHFEPGGVLTNASMTDYRVPRITDLPGIEVVLLDRPDVPSAGAGETPIIALGPASGWTAFGSAAG